MKKLLYKLLKDYFDELRADIDFCLMLNEEQEEYMEHSEKFYLVKKYYDRKLWNEKRVRIAVGKWITEEEAKEILGE